MKKSLIVTLILAVAMLVFVIIHNVQIYDAKNNIKYTEEVVYGDITAANGVRFQIQNQYNYIAWLTEGSVAGSLECDTQYMSKEELFMKMSEEIESDEDLIKEIIVYRPEKESFSCDFNETMYQAPAYEKMLKALAEDVAIGQTKEFELKLSDYCKYYDLTADVVCSNLFVNPGWSEKIASMLQVEVGDDVIMKGKITGYENTLSMSGSTKAHVYEYEIIGGIYPYARTICFENAAFFLMDYWDNAGNRLNASQYPPKIFVLDWTITGINNPNTFNIEVPKFILEEDTLQITGNILEICKYDELFILAEENKELFLYCLNPSDGELEKKKICDMDSEIVDVYMEGSTQGIFLMVDTVDGLKIYFLEKKDGQLMPYISVNYEEFECLKHMDGYKSQKHEEANYSKIAYVYHDKKLAMLWRRDDNTYNLLILSEEGVEYASVLHSNFKEGLDKESVKPLKIWFE